ncbi:Glutathione transporter 1 [Colletotrichum shisoi]|uniref:Glutathione transporter 1 n=1 Tax=Colletotrichum shisoi TaxID=2078593 RepID=A0A5Q4BCA8_9PEZI|nr:Glutathione transporter 1 [Colletotrichum shisoi]
MRPITKSGSTTLTAGCLRAKWTASRYRFFMLALIASICWYWFPDFIFPALGYFTWVCWIAPQNAVVNQVFGMKSGIGSSKIPALLGGKVVPQTNPQPAYKAEPIWWYWIACEFYPVRLRWYGVLMSFAVSAIFFVPLA